MSQESFITLIENVVSQACENNITLRSMGACAIRIHCPKFKHMHESMNRKLTDIDFVSYGKFSDNIYTLFKKMSLIPNERFITLHGESRQMYYDKTNECTVDIFLDKLEMSHTLEFKGRLELDYPTITLADLVLEKTQIVQINEKDIKDTTMMFANTRLAMRKMKRSTCGLHFQIAVQGLGFLLYCNDEFEED